MDILSRISGQAEQAEMFAVESESTTVKFEANQIKAVEVEETSGIALRAAVAGKLGFTAASGHIVEEKLVANLLQSAKYGDEMTFELPSPVVAPELQTYDPATAEASIDQFVAMGEEIIDALRSVDGDAQVGVEITRSVGNVQLTNNKGVDIAQQSSAFYVVIMVERVREDDVLMVYDTAVDMSVNDQYQQAVARLSRQMELAKRSATLPSGRMPVLFSPAGSYLLALPIMMGVNGQNVLRGTSPLSDKEGEQVFDPRLTIWDDPTITGLLHSSRYDDEGVPSRRKALIRNGVMEEYVTDLKTASLLNRASSGNGSRSLFSAPTPSLTNLQIEAGQTPVADMIQGIERGLLVEDVLGLGQGNAISGAFSNTVGLAYAIEKGEIVGRVKDVSLAGNIYEDLKQIGDTSQESYWINGRVNMPYVLLPELNIVGK